MESNNSQLYPIRQLTLFREKLKIENNEGLNWRDKQDRLAKLDQKLDDLKILVAAQ